MTDTPAANQEAPQHHWLVQYFLDFKVLADNPAAFWVVQFINLLDSIAYFAVLGVVTLFLTKTIGQDKVSTGYIVTAFTTLITIALFVAGFVTDALGIKRSLLIAQGLQLSTRLVIAACGLMESIPHRGWIVAVALVLSAPGAAMTQTVFQAANKRFSTRKSRSASFNIWYLIMNIGAMLGGLSIDLVRVTWNTSLSWIFAMGAVTALLNVVSTVLAIGQAEKAPDEPEATNDDGSKKAPVGGFGMLKNLVRESAFWRFIVLMVAVLGVRAVFAYMYLLMPQYWVEVIEQTGSAKTDQGLLQAINPILIVGGLILFIPIANRFNVFKMLVSGALISAMSLLIMALPWQWFGPTMAQGYFSMSVVMLVVLSLGELIWSPKLTEYTAAIAPHGQEGTYLGLSMVPWFAAKLTVSAMSGHMLERWVPEGRGMQMLCTGEVGFWSTPEAMWSLLLIWALAGPVVAHLFRKWLTEGADLDPAVKSTAEGSLRFRKQATVFGAVAFLAVGGFFGYNATRVQDNYKGPDGKPWAGQVRTEGEAKACGCWNADKGSIGAKLCKAAQGIELQGDEAKQNRAACLKAWFENPKDHCTKLCSAAPGALGRGSPSLSDRPECKKCGELTTATPPAPAEPSFCALRVTDLD